MFGLCLFWTQSIAAFIELLGMQKDILILISTSIGLFIESVVSISHFFTWKMWEAEQAIGFASAEDLWFHVEKIKVLLCFSSKTSFLVTIG